MKEESGETANDIIIEIADAVCAKEKKIAYSVNRSTEAPSSVRGSVFRYAGTST